MSYYIYPSEYGGVFIYQEGDKITRIAFTDWQNTEQAQRTELSDYAFNQIEEYLKGERREFDIPISYTGTDFQIAVWEAIMRIPYGQTCAYNEIGQNIGRPKSSCAVGNVCSKNPLALVIPCHRVINSRGGLSGYSFGVSVKRALLDIEKKAVLKQESEQEQKP